MPNILYKKNELKPQDDLTLFQEIAKGNSVAFEKFYLKYYKYLCRFGSSYENDIYLVEEKVSDVFYYIWQNKEALGEIKNPKVYVFTMTKNMIFQQKKIFSKTKINCEYSLVEHKVLVSPIEDDIIESEHEADLQLVLLKIIDKIPPKSKRIFEMSRIDGLKYQQIAQILNVSVNTIENHMSIALKTIALALGRKQSNTLK
ncbi:sigma-70 family RNA polymerase sigma factor [Myroides injenensis]|uniref:sigma-70 family RNA polymerase sigma factor n=1 Tax=Myroides injenensis TaxID=1183151 RepID=UPI00028A40D9|nr:sigma-70 family RNA polymerase sigma factor [Myroides injenensis]